MSWRWRAQCAGLDPERWCDRTRVSPWHRLHCAVLCPVQTDCAMDALETEADGVIRAGVLCDRTTKAARIRTERELIDVLTRRGVSR